MISVRQALDTAWKHFQTGQLQQAEHLYRQVLEVAPKQVDALHLLGVIAAQTGRDSMALDCLHAVLSLKPDFAAAHNNLGNVFSKQKKLAEAVASFQHAVRLEPDFAEAHNNLGNALREQGQLAEAVANLQQALRLRPDYSDAHFNLGLAWEEQGKLSEAEASLQQAVRFKPDNAEAHFQLALVLEKLGKHAEAAASNQQALRFRPDFAEAHFNLGTVFSKQRKLSEAVASYRQALHFKPDHAEAHNNLGNSLREQGNLAEAEASLRQALRLKPNFAEAHNNLGLTLQRQGNLREAEAGLQQALRLKPDFAEARQNLGNVLKDQGRLDEAVAAYRTALQLKPDAAHIHSNLVFVLQYHPGYGAEAMYEECRRWNQQHAEPFKKCIKPHTSPPDSERRLRIGYISPDFRDHPISCFTFPLLSNHDHRQCQIFCYADVARADTITERLVGLADVWRNTVGLPNQQVADLIRSDQIDILVDLAVHTANNRLLVFARKPAPVQVTWLGYPGTTGLSTIDYRLTDPYLDPPGLLDRFYSEESIRLPDSFWCYDPLSDQPPVNTLPALENGVVTFGCLNNFCKVNDGCLALWAQVLQAVPQSHLLLRAPRSQVREHVLARLKQAGIAELRVEFVDTRPRLEYLKLHHRIDLGLDPVPYNGHTTSLDAFWMGVPTLTLVGKTVVGRAGWSQLCNLGLKELAAETPEQYVALAAQLAGDLPALEKLRGTLRQRMQRSPLMDANRFARHMEQAYRHMWRRWCQQTKTAQVSEAGPSAEA